MFILNLSNVVSTCIQIAKQGTKAKTSDDQTHGRLVKTDVPK